MSGDPNQQARNQNRRSRERQIDALGSGPMRLLGRSTAAGAALLALAAPAVAQAAWSGGGNLSASVSDGFLDLGSDQSPNGRALALWRYVPSARARPAHLFAATAARTGGFRPARSRRIARRGQVHFRGAMADSGHGLIVFQELVRRPGPDTHRIRAIRVLPSGALIAPFTVSPTRVDAFTPRVTELPRGRFAVAWRSLGGTVQVAKVRGAAREGPVRTIGARSDQGFGIASAGEDLAVVWHSEGVGARITLWPGVGLPSAPQSLGERSTDLTVRGAGSTFVVGSTDAPDTGYAVRVQRFNAAGPLGGPASYRTPLTTTGRATPRVAVGPDGAALAVWPEELSVGETVRRLMLAAARPPPAPFGPAEVRTTERLTLSPEPAALNARGGAVVAWSSEISDPGSDIVVRAIVRPPGGAFGAVTTIGSGTEPTVVLRPDGSAIVVYLRLVGRGEAVATKVYTP